MHLTTLFSVAIIAAPVTLSLLYGLIYWQRSYQIGQKIRELGPQSHYEKKGTPSMGGVALLIAQTVALYAIGMSELSMIYLIALWGAGLIGIYDDLLKMLQKSSGVSMRFKMGGLSLLALAQSFLFFSNTGTLLPGYGFIGLPFIMAVILSFFAYTGTSNAINLTDGLDGLVSGVLLSFWLMVLLLCEKFTPLCLSWGWPIAEMIALSWVNLITLSSFLVFNIKPAFIFMGDSGALALGASIAAIFCYLQCPFLLLLLLFVPVLETISVMLQIASMRLYKKRLFKMAPLHHHFELSGLQENTIVIGMGVGNTVVGLSALAGLWWLYWDRIL